MLVYNYNPDTLEYVSSEEAFPCPLEDKSFLIPANATTIEPPTLAKNQVAMFVDGNWIVECDFRGQVFYNEELYQEETIVSIGVLSDKYIPVTNKKYVKLKQESELKQLRAIKTSECNSVYLEVLNLKLIDSEGYKVNAQLLDSYLTLKSLWADDLAEGINDSYKVPAFDKKTGLAVNVDITFDIFKNLLKDVKELNKKLLFMKNDLIAEIVTADKEKLEILKINSDLFD